MKKVILTLAVLFSTTAFAQEVKKLQLTCQDGRAALDVISLEVYRSPMTGEMEVSGSVAVGPDFDMIPLAKFLESQGGRCNLSSLGNK